MHKKKYVEHDTGMWNLQKYTNESVFIRLVYGFCLEELEIKGKGMACDNPGTIIDEFYQSFDKFISAPCRMAILCFLCIKKYSQSILSNVPRDIIFMISKKVWDDRNTFLPLNMETHRRYMYGRRDTDTYIGVTYNIIRSVFDHPTFVYGGEFCMSYSEPQSSVIELYQKFFPNYIPSKIYILDGDIYTSHYVYGDIMYGFYFNVTLETYIGSENTKINNIDFKIYDVGHNLHSKYTKFVGISLDSVSGVDEPVISMENANVFHKKYNYSEIVQQYGDLYKMKDDIVKAIIEFYSDSEDHYNEDIQVDIHEYPILGFVPLMCYCCT